MANKSLYVHNGLTVGSSVEINGTSGNILTSGIVTTTNATNASSTITGALQVRGGAGIGGSLHVGGEVFATLRGDATSSSTEFSVYFNPTTKELTTSSNALGYTGSQGDIGYTGSQGDIGYTGSQGGIGYTGSTGFSVLTETDSTPPVSAVDGTMWFNTEDATLSVYYDDGTSSQWVTVSGPKGFDGLNGTDGVDGTLAETDSTPPGISVDGQIWFNTEDATLNVYYDDGTSSQWVAVSGPKGAQGETGYTGSQGIAGEFAGMGYTGSHGYTGSKGEIGYTGSQGIAGEFAGLGYTGSAAYSTSITTNTGTSYILVAGDAGKTVTSDNSATNVITIPLNSAVPYDIGTMIAVIRKGTGTTQVKGDTGVTLNGTSGGTVTILSRWQGVTLLKINTDEWIASGAI